MRSVSGMDIKRDLQEIKTTGLGSIGVSDFIVARPGDLRDDNSSQTFQAFHSTFNSVGLKRFIPKQIESDCLESSLSTCMHASKKKRARKNPKMTHKPEKDKPGVRTYALEPIIYADSSPHTLVLGTHPSKVSLAMKTLSARQQKLRGGSGKQLYGNPRNCWWNIIGSALDFRRDMTTYEQQTEIFAQNGYALWDVIHSCQYAKNGSLDSQIIRNSIEPNNIFKLMETYPTLRRIVFPNNTAEFFKLIFERHFITSTSSRSKWNFVWRSDTETSEKNRRWFGKSKYDRVRGLPSTEVDRILNSSLTGHGASTSTTVELCVITSTSPACSQPRPGAKEKAIHKALFRLERPPSHYRCPICTTKPSNHWMVDCDQHGGYQQWRGKRRKKYKNAKSDPDTEGDRWYI